MLDEAAGPGRRHYSKGGYLHDLTDDVITTALRHGARMPSPMSQIHLYQMGGAVGRVAADATAFSGRNAGYTYNLVATWPEAAQDRTNVDALRALAADMAPLALNGGYVNFVATAGDPDAVRELYGDRIYERLVQLKRAYDPDNLFHVNQNVRPDRAARAAAPGWPHAVHG